LNENINIQAVPSFCLKDIQLAVLRLDELHPIVSGNKWFKLKYYLQQAQEENADTIASFGGPYSNHLVALAFAAKKYNLQSVGYVRSNEDEPITPTLLEAKQYGMHLKFLGRNNFQLLKTELLENNVTSNTYFVDEGGYGTLGAKGAATILSNEKNNSYSHIICAVGTGTMMAGLINAAKPHQHVIGIPVLKNEATIRNEITQLITNKETPFTLLHDFHLGGYAKTNQAQFDFMNLLWATEKIPTDMVYTSKLFMAVKSLLANNYFSPTAKILMIHSGGLQGNRSLPVGTLLF
jgi:1-aminocyclopropane-1-carboxylate deaminase